MASDTPPPLHQGMVVCLATWRQVRREEGEISKVGWWEGGGRRWIREEREEGEGKGGREREADDVDGRRVGWEEAGHKEVIWFCPIVVILYTRYLVLNL